MHMDLFQIVACIDISCRKLLVNSYMYIPTVFYLIIILYKL